MRKSIAIVFILAFAAFAFADEGLWPYNNFPKDAIRAKYGWAPTEAWLDHVRLSSVRFNNGGSGSFVSADGLVMTNHHVGEKCIQELGSAQHDYNVTGFYAPSRAKEAACPQLELNVLMSIQDVTNEVNAAVKPEMDTAQRGTAQRAAMARIEKDCRDKTGLRCDVVTLYEGGAFNLYRYKKYTDVRLVFAPEAAVAFFGGDPDNFTYPRYDLDVAFFRVYESGQPAKIEHCLKWNSAGPKEGDLVFMSGNPGSTGRNLTYAQLETLRDHVYPNRLALYKQRLDRLFAYSAKGAENARQAHDIVFSYQNSQKAMKGYQSGLLDKAVMAKKLAAEKDLRGKVAADPRQKDYIGAWEAIAAAQKPYAEILSRYQLFEMPIGLRQSHLFQAARHLVRIPAEKAKANDQRLPDYRESNLESIQQDLFSTAPVYPALEKVMLGAILTEMQQQFADDALLKDVLHGRTPEQAAEAFVNGTKLADLQERRRLSDGGQKAIDASSDAMIRLAVMVDPYARKLLKRYEDEVQAVERKNGALLAKALFATRGTSVYPEATFTLRMSYGVVKGYAEGARQIPFTTTFDGAFKKATGADPYKLPDTWLKAKAKVNPSTPLNFVNTADSIGGNSGSPMVNKAGELVGVNFDSNIHRLPNRFMYTDTQSRSVCVHSGGIIEALRKIYNADALVKELLP